MLRKNDIITNSSNHYISLQDRATLQHHSLDLGNKQTQKFTQDTIPILVIQGQFDMSQLTSQKLSD